ncbi:hypothetical protein D3C81_1378390 [compost metagenome]
MVHLADHGIHQQAKILVATREGHGYRGDFEDAIQHHHLASGSVLLHVVLQQHALGEERAGLALGHHLYPLLVTGDRDQGGDDAEFAHLVVHPVLAHTALERHEGMAGQPLVDGRPPGRAGMHRFAVEHVDQRRRGVLADHHRHAGGVYRPREAHRLAPLQGFRGRAAEEVDLAATDGLDDLAAADRLVAHLHVAEAKTGLHPVGDLLADLDGVAVGLAALLAGERRQVGQVAEGQGVAAAHALERIGTGQHRQHGEQTGEQQTDGVVWLHVHILIPTFRGLGNPVGNT